MQVELPARDVHGSALDGLKKAAVLIGNLDRVVKGAHVDREEHAEL